MDYENDIPTDEYQPELSPAWYYTSDIFYYEDEADPDEEVFESEPLDDTVEHLVQHYSHWTSQQLVFILIAVVLFAAVLVFVIFPWLQMTLAPAPLYMPPPSTPLSKL